MAIRVILVVLVVGLGLDFSKVTSLAGRSGETELAMPNGPEAFAVEAAHPRPAMIEVVELNDDATGNSARPASIEVVKLETPAAAVDTDAGFRVVVEEMSASFAADVAAVNVEQVADLDEQVAELDPALAEVPGYETIVDPSATEPASSIDRSRLADAVRLTGQAADAWANLLR